MSDQEPVVPPAQRIVERIELVANKNGKEGEFSERGQQAAPMQMIQSAPKETPPKAPPTTPAKK